MASAARATIESPTETRSAASAATVASAGTDAEGSTAAASAFAAAFVADAFADAFVGDAFVAGTAVAGRAERWPVRARDAEVRRVVGVVSVRVDCVT